MPTQRLRYVVVAVLATIGVALFSTAYASAAPRRLASPPEDVGLCYHTDPSDYHCPDSTATFFATASSIAKITITIVDKSGRSKTTELPGGTDAIFMSNYAVKNFLIRYYRATKQSAKARSLTAFLASHSQKVGTH